MKLPLPLICSVTLLTAAGCNRQPVVIVEAPAPTPLPVARTETFETRALGKDLDTFEQDPSPVNSAKVRKSFAEIDGEIAELEEHVAKKTGDARAEAARKLQNLRAYRDGEHVRFVRLQAKAPLVEKRAGVEDATAVRRDGGAEKVGEKIDDASRAVGEGVKDAADAVRDRIR